MKDFVKKREAAVILLFVFLSLFLFLIVPHNKITGYFASDLSSGGGDVTETNISVTENASYWQAFYGELFEDSQTGQRPSSMAQGGDVTELNLTLPCIGEEIYASINESAVLQNAVEGDVQAVDSYLQLIPTHLESGSSVFITTSDFLVESSNVTNVPTTYTKVFNSPGDTTFSLGLLNESNNLIFIGSISYDTVGFDNKRHDYQMMMPVNQSGATYYFFSDCEAAVPVPIPTPTPTGGAKKIFGFCGDDVCQIAENCSTCPVDCGSCPILEEIGIPEEENITVKEIVKKRYVFIYEAALDEVLLLLKQLLLTTRGLAVLLFIIIVILFIIMIGIYKKKKFPRLVFMKGKS